MATVLFCLTACGGGGNELVVNGTVIATYGAEGADAAITLDQLSRMGRDGGRCVDFPGNVSGSRMVVRDENGEAIATTRLSSGVNRVSGCEVTFEVSLPEREFYTFEIAAADEDERDTFSREEIEEAGGRVEFAVT